MAYMEQLRRQFAKGLVVFLWFNVALIAACAFIEGVGAPWIPIAGSILISGAATAMWANSPTGAATRIVTSMALSALVALLLSEFAGSRYIIDIHMYFFATLAIVAGWCDWRAVVANAGVTAVHHIVLNFILPSLIFPDGSDLPRVLIHAAIVCLQTAVLIWLTNGLARSFAMSEQSMSAAAMSKS